jgi:phosphoadenosine phosphosulfate reductase
MSPHLDIDTLNNQFETESPQVILKWAWRTFGSELAASSSFQSQSLPLLHIISQTVPELTIIFIDTGFHFPETLAYRDRLERELYLNIKNVGSKADSDEFKFQNGELYHRNPDLCCQIYKLKPFQDAKADLKAWITGIRRDQTQARADTPVISMDQDGLYKICPMVNWTREDIWSYIDDHQLPGHPLLEKGYLSVGCGPCTRPVFSDEGERDGRWADQMKTECGLHLPIQIKDESVDS